ncbi:YqaE/Pmp3 family membrane protein [Fulvivirga sp. M361]|nr:YqaE/Pmp3 family membrane protein [Fulvivirga sp. M361]
MMILAFIIPPLGVGLTYGLTSEFWISLLLTILFWLPGAIYSLFVVHQHYKG